MYNDLSCCNFQGLIQPIFKLLWIQTSLLNMLALYQNYSDKKLCFAGKTVTGFDYIWSKHHQFDAMLNTSKEV